MTTQGNTWAGPGAPPHRIFPRIWLIKIHPSSTIPAPNANTSRCKLEHPQYMFPRPPHAHSFQSYCSSNDPLLSIWPFCYTFPYASDLENRCQVHFLTFHFLQQRKTNLFVLKVLVWLWCSRLIEVNGHWPFKFYQKIQEKYAWFRGVLKYRLWQV